HLNPTFGLKQIHLASRIDWRALEKPGGDHLAPGSRPATRPLLVLRDRALKLGHLFVNLQRSETHKRILFYVLVVCLFVDPRPKIPCRGYVSGLGVHERSHGSHPLMGTRFFGTFIKRFRRRLEVAFLVLEISERVVEAPILRIRLDAALNKIHRSVNVSRAVWWRLREEDGSELVGCYEMRIQGDGYIQQRSKGLVFLSAGLMFASKVLDDASPVNIRQ